MSNPVHHIELWTHDLAEVDAAWTWLLGELGWRADHDPTWPEGRTWTHETGVYLVLEQSPAVRGTRHDRLLPGLNHLALRAPDRAALDGLRAAGAERGWSELYAERYPHAGGEAHTALFVENAQGFEVEIVVDGA